MMLLSEEQIEQIAIWVEGQKLRHEELQEELLDHLCCAVEERMAGGIAFDDAFGEARSGFGDKGLKGVERQTIFLLTYQSRLMKLVTATTAMLAISFSLISLEGFSQSIPSLSPLGDDLEITSAFGMRMHPTLKVEKMHMGVDYRADMGTDVLSTADGTVLIAGVDPEAEPYGIIVLIEHSNGYQTRYAHLSEVTVEVGQEVSGGDRIGKVGSSGLSFGPHLHYEVIHNGRRVNPAEFIPQ